MPKKYQKDQRTVLEVIVVGIFSGLWRGLKALFGVKKKRRFSEKSKQEIRAKKAEVEAMLGSDNIHELRQAVVEADKLVDKILIECGYDGNTFAERLRSGERFIDKNIYESIWQGHKLRNRLVHEDNNFHPSQLKGAVNNLLKYVRNF